MLISSCILPCYFQYLVQLLHLILYSSLLFSVFSSAPISLQRFPRHTVDSDVSFHKSRTSGSILGNRRANEGQLPRISNRSSTIGTFLLIIYCICRCFASLLFFLYHFCSCWHLSILFFSGSFILIYYQKEYKPS
jgi:hypothetical protein